MAVLNFADREITAKIVYFGAPGAGCNTNVHRLWTQLHEQEDLTCGRLHQFGAADSREHTWFFDIRPPADPLAGFSVRYRVYSMPGGVDDLTHREEVMRQVDAIVLVADSRPDANAPNEEAMLELEELVAAQGLDLAKLPVVLQVNHTDNEDARNSDDVTFALNPFGFPVQKAAARAGEGVRETFEAITTLTRSRIADNIAGGDGAVKLTAVHSETLETDEDVARQHLRALDQGTPVVQTHASNATPSTPAPAPPDEVDIPFQPRDFAGYYPVQVLHAAIEEGRVFVDVELEKMGGGSVRQLRVHLENRPTDAAAVEQAPTFSLSEDNAPDVMGVTDHLPDKVDFNGLPVDDDPFDLPPLAYGIIGVAGGLLIGSLLGFLLFS